MAVKKKIPSASKHRLMIFGTISIFLIGNLIVSFISYMIKINQLKNVQNKLADNLISLKQDADDLSTTINKLKDPEYVARFARENYYYSVNGEYIIKIEEKKENEILTGKEDKKYQYYIYGGAFIFIIIFLYIVKRK